MKKSIDIRKLLVFPMVYLILDLVEDFLIYKSELVQNVWMRTGVVITILAFGISIVAYVLVPFFQGGLETLHKTTKKHGGFGEFLFAAFLMTVIYFMYYVKTNEGLSGLLPPVLLN